MTLFKDKYRTETTRLSAWDYGADGYYFVTVCTYDRSCLLGDIINGEMTLSPQGRIVAEEWQKSPSLREYVSLDEWIVMPNHFHGIIILRNDPGRDALNASPNGACNQNQDACNASLRGDLSNFGRDASNASPLNASPLNASPLNASPLNASQQSNRFGPQSNNLAAIMRGFKSASTSRIRAAGFDFAWQPRYYDHIIRDEQALKKIREYIVSNPMKWEIDKNHPHNFTQSPVETH